MAIIIDPTSPVPRYQQLAEALRGMIGGRDGLQPGDRLPSTHELVKETGLAPATVAKGVAELVREDLVVSVPGIGMVVR